eukprot:9604-Heterococcus_DN1.PRE.7
MRQLSCSLLSTGLSCPVQLSLRSNFPIIQLLHCTNAVVSSRAQQCHLMQCQLLADTKIHEKRGRLQSIEEGHDTEVYAGLHLTF